MKYDLGDSVRIIAKNLPGEICDVSICNGRLLYIVDSHEYCDIDKDDWLITVEEHEIESYDDKENG